MAQPLQPIRSTDDLSVQTGTGLSLFVGGDIYQQYGATAAIASSTAETSILKPSVQASLRAGITGSAIPVLPANSLTLGSVLYGTFRGIIANTSTPNLTVRVVLKDATGTVVYALATTGATAMSNVSTSDLEIKFEAAVAAVGSSGSLVGWLNVRYAGTLITPVPAAVTVDTTAAYSVDVLLTWGTSSASNTATVYCGQIGIK